MFKLRAGDVVLCNLLFSISQIILHSCMPQVILLKVCQEMKLPGEKIGDDNSIKKSVLILLI